MLRCAAASYVLGMPPFDRADLPPLPNTALTREALDLMTRAENPALANHSVRSYLFARLAADARGLTPGADYDPELLLVACVLHDIGLTSEGDLGQRFEVNSADVAAEMLGRHGRAWRDVDAVWQAIALNTSIGIAERRGPIAELTLVGVSIDFGQDAEFVPDAIAAAVHRAYPRLSIVRVLTDAVVEHATRTSKGAPPFSMAAEILRQHASSGTASALETMARSSRWGAA
jgi:hypothetical protein